MVAEFASMDPLLPLSNPPVIVSLSQLKTALLVTAFVLPVDWARNVAIIDGHYSTISGTKT
jgi:hypothetical protein